MANALYTEGKQNLLDKKFDLDTDDMRVILIDHDDDTPVPSTDDALDDISAGEIATSDALNATSIANGTFDADNETLSAVPGGGTVDSLTIYLHTGTPTTSFLLVYIDTGTNLTGGFTPNGGDVTIAWHASGIFSL